jgi:hypothetical protein
MTVRSVAIFRDGQLWLDDCGAYSPASRMSVALMAERQSSLRCPEAREATRQCNEALKQFAAMEEAK